MMMRMAPMDAISNAELRAEDIPAPEADWSEIGTFALTFHGYEACGSFEECARVANAARPSTLSELRTCPFFEQRRWRHLGDEPDDESLDSIRGLVERIGAKFVSGELA